MIVQHSRSYILSHETKRALELLYKEIEALEKKVKDLEREVSYLDK